MATYSQINPASVIRDALIEAPDDYALDMAFPKIFGIPAGPDGPGGTGVVESRAIDMSGTPGILAGSIVVRNDRDLLGANAQQSVGRALGLPSGLCARPPDQRGRPCRAGLLR